MANWAMYVVIPEDGGAHETYAPRFGAVGIDLDLLAGPDVSCRSSAPASS
ncbi:hypothetical protein [Streptomyces tritici]